MHETFRASVMQREGNAVTQLAILITCIGGYFGYVTTQKPIDPMMLIFVTAGVWLLSLFGIHLCNLHGYQFRYDLFQLHKIEHMMGIQEYTLNSWHNYEDYINPKKSTNVAPADSIEPPNVIKAFRTGFYAVPVFVLIVTLCVFPSEVPELITVRLLVRIVFALVAVILMFLINIWISRYYKRKFKSLISKEQWSIKK